MSMLKGKDRRAVREEGGGVNDTVDRGAGWRESVLTTSLCEYRRLSCAGRVESSRQKVIQSSNGRVNGRERNAQDFEGW